ncbi:MAG: carbon-nitrogen hydrolase family protein [Pseudomonadota bacterium]
MSLLRAACIQMRATPDVMPNIEASTTLIRAAARDGATFVATPEMTNILDIRPGQARTRIATEADDLCLRALCDLASELRITLLIGSLAVALPGDERFANRSYLIGPTGDVLGRYDKIHMFDVEVGDGQAYRESNAYRAGRNATLVHSPIGRVGMTICYDVRFPHLYRGLGQEGAQLITIPAAFTRVTGEAHWHVLVRARAIETGCFILAPAQGGQHEDGRETFGHSLIVSPWGEILAEADHDMPGFIIADLDLAEVARARARIPALKNDQRFSVSTAPTA